MINPCSMVGEFEINKTAEMFKEIKIVVQYGGSVLSYGDEFDDPNPIFILYTPLGQNSGHYDCLMQRQSSHFPNVSLSPIAGLELPCNQHPEGYS